MLGKLIKYDLRAQRRTLLPILGAVLAASVVSSALMKLVAAASSAENSAAASITSASTGVIIFFSAAAIILCPFIVFIFAVVHFYRSFFTDEGYLTFTLPVKRSSLLASKFISTLVWLMSSLAVTAVSLAVILLFGTSADKFVNTEAIADAAKILYKLFFSDGGTGTVILYIAYAAASVLYLIPAFFLAVTIGSSVALKHRGLASIGFMYVINLASSAASGIVNFLIMTVAGTDIMSDISFVQTVSVSVSLILNLGFGAAAYILCLHFTKNKLDLQ